MNFRVLLSCLFTVVLSPAWSDTTPVEPVQIDEWPVPWSNSRPRDPFAESADSVWFVGQAGHYLGHLDVNSGKMRQVSLPDKAGPHNLIVDADGVVWYAGNLKGYIGRYDPGDGNIEKIPMPDPAAGDPHTLIFGADGDIWFTVQHNNFVGRLSVADRSIDLVKVPTARARPYGIAIAPNGIVWVVLFGSNKLASIDPKSLVLTEHALPREDARPRRVEVSTDGRVWYVDYAQGYLGAFVPDKTTFQEWRLPSGAASRPYGMEIDSRDRIWVVETGVKPNRFVGFDPLSEQFIGDAPVPSGGGTVRHMHYHEPSNTVWFGTDTNTVGRAQLP